jgi:hypothetical protein
MKLLTLQDQNRTVDVTIKTDICNPNAEVFTVLTVLGYKQENAKIGLDKFVQLGSMHQIGEIKQFAKEKNLQLTIVDNSKETKETANAMTSGYNGGLGTDNI